MKKLLCSMTLLAFFFASFSGHAGEISCSLGECDLDRVFLDLDWKPSSRCYKPSEPFMLYGSTVSEYNHSVRAFNDWISQVKGYMQCISNEAEADAKKMPKLILEAAQKVQQRMAEDVQQKRSALELMRH